MSLEVSCFSEIIKADSKLGEVTTVADLMMIVRDVSSKEYIFSQHYLKNITMHEFYSNDNIKINDTR